MFIIRMLRNSYTPPPQSKIKQHRKKVFLKTQQNNCFITKTQQNLDIFGSDMLVDFFK